MRDLSKIRIILMVFLCLVLGWTNLFPEDQNLETLVITKNGPVRGEVEQVVLDNRAVRSVRVYTGIPYAEPPIGKRRWAEPVAKGKWKLVTNSDCPACPQNPTGISPTPTNQDEDCLYLNIWAPGKSRGKKLPVLIYIHGGGFIGSHGRAKMFDGAYMAAAGEVILVTFNYRLGPLGFMVFKDRDGETIEGNYGMMDQRLAIQWIADNIAAFGGDPGKITIFGQSAGAIAVAGHLAMENPAPFQAAIMQSNPYSVPFFSMCQAQKIGSLLAKRLNCKTVAELRELNWCSIISNSELQADALQTFGIDGFLEWKPVIDGKLFKRQPINVKPQRPLIIGTNKDEGVMLAELIIEDIPIPFTNLVYAALIKVLFPGEKAAAAILEKYPPGTDPKKAFADVLTHYLMTTGSHYYIEAVSPNCRVFPYLFTHVPHCNITPLEECCDVACHADDVMFVFHSFDKVIPGTDEICKKTQGDCKETERERLFSDRLVALWTSFARDKYPTAHINIDWENYKASNHYLTMSGPDDLEPGRPWFGKRTGEYIEKLCNYDSLWKEILEARIAQWDSSGDNKIAKLQKR